MIACELAFAPLQIFSTLRRHHIPGVLRIEWQGHPRTRGWAQRQQEPRGCPLCGFDASASRHSGKLCASTYCKINHIPLGGMLKETLLYRLSNEGRIGVGYDEAIVIVERRTDKADRS